MNICGPRPGQLFSHNDVVAHHGAVAEFNGCLVVIILIANDDDFVFVVPRPAHHWPAFVDVCLKKLKSVYFWKKIKKAKINSL